MDSIIRVFVGIHVDTPERTVQRNGFNVDDSLQSKIRLVGQLALQVISQALVIWRESAIHQVGSPFFQNPVVLR